MNNVPKRIKEYNIEQSDRWADSAINELRKVPPDWDQVYEYIEMIGGSFTDAVNVVYDITKDENERERYLSYLENESKRIKDRIISVIKSICK